MKILTLCLMIVVSAVFGVMSGYFFKFGHEIPFIDGMRVYNAIELCEKKQPGLWDELLQLQAIDSLFVAREHIMFEKDCARLIPRLTVMKK